MRIAFFEKSPDPCPAVLHPEMTSTISQTDVRLVAGDWPFAVEHRAEIAAHWTTIIAKNPHLWNGQIFIARNLRLTGATLSADMYQTDFAAFLAWRDWGFPDTNAYNVFGSGLVTSRQGAVILGRMAPYTARAGFYVMPGGALDQSDLNPDGTFDISGSTIRELKEETGLRASQAEPAGQFVTLCKQRVSLNSIFHFDIDTNDLLARIKDQVTAMAEQEFDDIIAITGPDELKTIEIDDYTQMAVEQYFNAFARTAP